jgi:hypothetical protein
LFLCLVRWKSNLPQGKDLQEQQETLGLLNKMKNFGLIAFFEA